MNIIRRFFLAVCILTGIAATADAQTFRKNGYKVKDLVPMGWTFAESRGDINRDGHADLLIVAYPSPDPENISLDSDDFWKEQAPVLAVYLGGESGRYNLYRRYDSIVPYSAGKSVKFEAQITRRGTIRTHSRSSENAESLEVTDEVFVFRYQNGGIYKIGYSSEVSRTDNGAGLKVSMNYSTGKVQTISFDTFHTDDSQGTDKWEDFDPGELKPLGNEMLGTM